MNSEMAYSFGTIRSSTETSTKPSPPSKYNFALSVIPSRSRRTMWTNYPKSKLVRAVSEYKYRMNSSHLYARVVVKTSNLVISRRCHAGHGKEIDLL